jgi:catechol 2,3-dioxygenase-like lactoylglutathione lyase family enzyme
VNQRLRFLLDMNILIPLQDSMLFLQPSLANFVRLAGVGGHQLLYHPASKIDIERDKNISRRSRTLERLAQYTLLEGEPAKRGNGSTISFNVESVEQGDAFHAAGIANGGSTCEDPPGFREAPSGKLYLAYLRDPDGNKISALYRPPK